MKRIIDRVFLPEFRNGYYDKGILEGIDATLAEIANRPPGSTSFAPPTVSDLAAANANGQSADQGGFPAIIAFLLGLPGIGGIFYLFQKWQRRRPRSCPNCASKMGLLTEEHEDEYLRACGHCAHMTIKRYPRIFSGLGACPSCNYRLLESERTTITHATYSSSGKRRIDYDCLNCDYVNTEYQTIPRKQRSSSSSSSGSSSFGGGSSSGGGASGSW